MAVASVLQGLAKEVVISPALQQFSQKRDSDFETDEASLIRLPGPQSDGKASLERELSALVKRVDAIQYFVVS